MLTEEENQLLTRVGPGTPGGLLLRAYWQPVALAEEMRPGMAPKPVRLLGEDLVLFRDEQSRLGLLRLHCAHRGCDLSYGRVEDGGLRCLYHGWLYDVQGQCLDQPNVPEELRFCDRVRQGAYPCREAGELIFAYLGSGEPPLLPAHDVLHVPEEQRISWKAFLACSYLQGNEGNLDPSHVPFLHRKLQGGALRAGHRWVAGAEGAEDATDFYKVDASTWVDVEETRFGLRMFATRRAPGGTHLRTTYFVLPNASVVPGEDGEKWMWHVPIDDTHHWKYQVDYVRSGPLRDKALRQAAILEDRAPGSDYRLLRNLDNRYLQDRQQMQSDWAAGLGPSFLIHDNFATETQGPIQDRTQERLAVTDKAIIQGRRLLLAAMQEVQQGHDPLYVLRSPRDNAFPELRCLSAVVPTGDNWRDYWDRTAAPSHVP